MDKILTPTVATFIISCLVMALIYVGICWLDSDKLCQNLKRQAHKKANDPYKELVAVSLPEKTVYLNISRSPTYADNMPMEDKNDRFYFDSGAISLGFGKYRALCLREGDYDYSKDSRGLWVLTVLGVVYYPAPE